MTVTATTARYARWDGVGMPIHVVCFALSGQLSPGEVLVAIDLATVCGSDLHTIGGRRSSSAPVVLGHEQVGRVLAVGPAGSDGNGGPRHVDGTPLRVGDRLVWSVAASCGRCRRCRRGISQKCNGLVKYGHQPLDEAHPLTGGFASHCVLAPGTVTAIVPDAVPDFVAAPASCATATVAAVIDAAGPLGPEERVLITGGGMLGVTAAAMVARTGAEVVVAEPDAERRRRSLRFGATDVTSIVDGGDFDVALELSGAAPAVRSCLDSLTVGGTTVLAGSVSPGPTLELDPERLVRGLHTVVGVHNYAPRHLAAAVEFLATEHARYPFAELTAGTWKLEDLDAAFVAARASGAAPRQAIRP